MLSDNFVYRVQRPAAGLIEGRAALLVKEIDPQLIALVERLRSLDATAHAMAGHGRIGRNKVGGLARLLVFYMMTLTGELQESAKTKRPEPISALSDIVFALAIGVTLTAAPVVPSELCQNKQRRDDRWRVGLYRLVFRNPSRIARLGRALLLLRTNGIVIDESYNPPLRVR